MCGREPNFELTHEEKDELSKLSWDEFLTMTRSAINSKSISTHPSCIFLSYQLFEQFYLSFPKKKTDLSWQQNAKKNKKKKDCCPILTTSQTRRSKNHFAGLETPTGTQKERHLARDGKETCSRSNNTVWLEVWSFFGVNGSINWCFFFAIYPTEILCKKLS